MKTSDNSNLLKKDDLSKKEIIKRTIMIIVLLALALGAFSYVISGLIGKDDGWHRIDSDTKGAYFAEEFVFNYYLGASNVSPNVEYKRLAALYSNQLEKLYKLFTIDEIYDNNMAYINATPNTQIQVDEVLYEALKSLDGTGILKLAPIYEYYEGIFSAQEDWETFDFDPMKNELVKAEFDKILNFIKNDISIEFLGENKIKLCVSDEYLSYASKNKVGAFLDFNWTKNAFIVDEIAKALINNGYTKGTLSSYDGFVRNLDDSGAQYSINVLDLASEGYLNAGRFDYEGQTALVVMRSFPIVDLDLNRYYRFSDGKIYNCFISPETGLSKNSVNSILGYKQGGTCAEVLTKLIPVYIADEIGHTDIDIIYCKDKRIYYSDEKARIEDVYSSDSVSYEKEIIKTGEVF